MGNKRKSSGIVVPVNPLMTATSGMSGGGGDPMPPAIHGQVVEEQVEDEKSVKPKSTGIRWIRLR